MNLNIFFVTVTPGGELFQVVMGDTWDQATQSEGSWTLDEYIADEKDIVRTANPLSAQVAERPIREDEMRYGLGKHPTIQGWRLLVVQAFTLFEAVSTAQQYLNWEKFR